MSTTPEVGSFVITSPKPFGRLFLCLLDGFKHVLAQPFTGKGADITLNIGVLLGFTCLDVFGPDIVFPSPSHKFPTDVLWAVVDADRVRFLAVE